MALRPVKNQRDETVDHEMERTCLECSLPDCMPMHKDCAFRQKYGFRARSITLIQESCGMKELKEVP